MSSTSSSDDETDLDLERVDSPCVEPSAKRVRLRTKSMAPSTWVMAKKIGLKTGTFQRLLRMQWPCFMFNMLWMCCEEAGPPQEDLWCIEYMSGVGRIASHFTEQGLLAASYDIIDAPVFQDILRPDGFATALRLTSRLKGKAFMHW